MDKCNDERIGRKVHAYELGMLGPDESDAVELHLLECPRCMREFRELSEVSRALHRDAGIHDLIRDLDETDRVAAREASTEIEAGPGSMGSRKWLRPLAIVAAAVIVLMLKPWNLRFETDDPAVASDNRLVVMPFELLTGEEDTTRIADIIGNLLITDISESKYLQVVTGSNRRDLQGFVAWGDSLDSPDSAHSRISEATRAKWILSGSVVQIEPTIVVTVQLKDATAGAVISSHRVTGEEGGTVFEIVDRLGARIREDLLTPLNFKNEFDPLIADVTTHSAEAYRWYLEGHDKFGMLYLDEAKDCYQRALSYDSTFAMSYWALVYFDFPNALENAVKYAEQATQKERLYIYSLQASRAGDMERSVSLLEELVKRYPDEKIAWMELALIAEADFRHKDAIEYLRRALEADPWYVDAINLLAYTYFRDGDHRRALEAADSYLAIAPDQANPYDTRGEILAGSGMLADAIASYERATELKPDFFNYMSLTNLGRLYVFNGQYEQARTCFRRVTKEGDARARSRARVCIPLVSLYEGKLVQALNELDDALVADRLEEGATSNPDLTALKYYVRSTIMERIGDTEGAVSATEMALEVMEQAASQTTDLALVRHMYALASAGQDRKAGQLLEEFKGSLEEQGRGMDSYWKAAGMISFAEGDFGKAAQNFERLSDPNWKRFDDRYLLARAYIETREYEKAIVLLEDALADFNDWVRFYCGLWGVEAYYFLAYANEQTSDNASAIEHYESFLQIWSDADKSLPLVSEARKRLTRLKSSM